MKKIDVKECASLLKEYDNYLILSHRNPDGDTLGSAFALKRTLDLMGKKSFVKCVDPMHHKYSYLWDGVDNSEFAFDKIIAVDVADKKLLGDDFQEKYGDNVFLCIDHHMSNTLYAEKTLLEERAAACEVVYELMNELGVSSNRYIRNCIYTGISTDTGCFRYQNMTSSVFKIAARLMDDGVDSGMINKLMFETKSKSFLKLEMLARETLEYHFEGKCAIITITQDMYKNSGSDESECHPITALPRQIEGVLVGAVIKEAPDGEFSISVRTEEGIDASEICARLGGGGQVGYNIHVLQFAPEIRQ